MEIDSKFPIKFIFLWFKHCANKKNNKGFLISKPESKITRFLQNAKTNQTCYIIAKPEASPNKNVKNKYF